MAYTSKNYKSKKDLKADVANGVKVSVFNPGMGGPVPANGVAYVEGPHYPQPHKWYAKVTLKDGYVVKVS